MLFIHRFYYLLRNNISKTENLFYGIFLLILLIVFYEIINFALPNELKKLFPLIILTTDFSIKFFLKPDVSYNVLPYLALPINKKSLVGSILLLEIISVWNLYFCASIFVLFHIDFFYENDASSFLFSIINIYLLFVFNNYCVICIKYTFNKLFSFLLFPVFFCLIFPTYLLFGNGILCTVITLALIIIILYCGKQIITREIYKQLDDFSL